MDALKKPENLFLILCLFWGLVFGITNPPFQGYDEASHFYKVYGYVEGSMNFKKITVRSNGEKFTFPGQILPESVINTANANALMNLDPSHKTSFSKTVQMFNIPLNKEKKVFTGYPVPFYTPFSYVLMIPCVWLLTLFGAPPLAMMYVCRLCSLLAYASLAYFAVKITPVKKLMFLTIGLLPMAVYSAASLSADGITNGLALLLCAYALRLGFGSKNVTPKQSAIFFTLAFFLTLCKFTYLPLILAFLFIKDEKFDSKKTKYTAFWIGFSVCLAQIFVLTGTNLWLGRDLTSFSSTLDKADLFKTALLHPFAYFWLVLKTLFVNGKQYLMESVGCFGWGTVLMPFWSAVFAYAVLILTGAVNCRETPPEITAKDKWLMALSVGCVIFLIMSVCYLLFTWKINQPFIDNFQGRYLIALLPFALLVFNSKFLNFKTNAFKVFVLVSINFILAVSLVKLIMRFYY